MGSERGGCGFRQFQGQKQQEKEKERDACGAQGEDEGPAVLGKEPEGGGNEAGDEEDKANIQRMKKL